jgi:hypothetical protein
MIELACRRYGVVGDLLPAHVLLDVRDEVLELMRVRLLSVTAVAAPRIAAASTEADVIGAFHDALVETLALKH